MKIWVGSEGNSLGSKEDCSSKRSGDFQVNPGGYSCGSIQAAVVEDFQVRVVRSRIWVSWV